MYKFVLSKAEAENQTNHSSFGKGYQRRIAGPQLRWDLASAENKDFEGA